MLRQILIELLIGVCILALPFLPLLIDHILQ